MVGFKSLNQAQINQVIDLLRKEYANVKYYLNFSTPVELLVAAILSAQTKDSVVNSLTPALFSKYKTIENFASASKSDLLKYTSKVSFADKKVENIIKACKIIQEKYGGKVPNKMDDLVSLPGVGRKTANTILINAYGIIEGIPVDTWVIKLAYRIGLSESKKPDDIEKDLMKEVPRAYWSKIAYILKEHGHKVCQSTVPICSSCPIRSLCPRNGVVESK